MIIVFILKLDKTLGDNVNCVCVVLSDDETNDGTYQSKICLLTLTLTSRRLYFYRNYIVLILIKKIDHFDLTIILTLYVTKICHTVEDL